MASVGGCAVFAFEKNITEMLMSMVNGKFHQQESDFISIKFNKTRIVMGAWKPLSINVALELISRFPFQRSHYTKQ